MARSAAQLDPQQPTAWSSFELQEAFAGFIATSSKLERSYRDLRAEVAELNLVRAREQRALDQSLTEQALLSRRMEQIFCSVPSGLLLMCGDGSVLKTNPEAARLLALSAAQLPGAPSLLENISQFLSSDLSSKPHADEPDEKTLEMASSEGRHWIAMRKVALDSKERDGSSSTTWLVSLQDVTARVRGEQDRERAQHALALAEISSLLAHEIRNPLASMELFADLLVQIPERSEEWRSHLQAGIRSLAATVTNVLLLSGTEAPPTERLDLLAELRPILQFLQPLALQAEVTLALTPMSGAIWAQVNRTSLHQLLMNLCINAFRHTPRAGEVHVRCERSASGKPLVIVADTGTGMAPEQLAALFTPGATGSRTRTGLGLAVCDLLMRQQRGSVRVSSGVGVGSTFTLEFEPA